MIINKEWLREHELTSTESLELAIFAAELVLPTWEAEFPDRPKPRMAIYIAKVWLECSAEENSRADWDVYVDYCTSAIDSTARAIHHSIKADPDVKKTIIDKATEIIKRR